MNNYVIFKEFDILWLTHEENYNKPIRNASKVINVNNFQNVEAVKNYLIREFGLQPSQIIDKTNA